MRILAFDTATRATTVALADDAGAVFETRDDPPAGARPGHAARLLPMITEGLEQAGVGWPQIDRIAVGVGPGTFTGLRIGVATARALAGARAIPLVGVSTLQSLALAGARSSSVHAESSTIVSVIDARRREVFAAGWRRSRAALGELLLEPAAMAPDALVAALDRLGPRALAIGDGAVEFRSVLELSGALIPEDESGLHRVAAINHCLLARELPAGAPERVSPEYLRLPDAEITRRRNAQR